MFLSWLACTQIEVTLQGTVYESVDPTAALLQDAEIRIINSDGALVTEAEAVDGHFEAIVPAGGVVFLEVTAPGYAVTTFTGIIGLQPVQPIEDGVLYGISETERSGILADFAGCPGVDNDQGLVIGEIHAQFIDPITGGSPSVGTGIAEVLRNGESTWIGCYLDAEGLYDPEAIWTGETGRFLVSDVEPGIYDLFLSAQISEGLWTEATYPLWIPDRSLAISPWYPAWVPIDP